MNNIKYLIRKNKVASGILKPIYRKLRAVRRLPIERRAFKEADASINNMTANQNKIWYLCAPTHMNLGDQAQKICIKRWLRDNYPEHQLVVISSNAFNYKPKAIVESIRSKLNQNDLFIMQSGYTFDGLHPDEVAHRVISQSFKENTIVFFPQTILYKSERLKDKMSKAIDSHHKTLLLARDRVSYESALSYYPHIKKMLYPDIVTSLIGSTSFSEERSGILLCMRNDGEKLYSNQDITHLRNKLSIYGKVDITDTSEMNPEAVCDDSLLWNDILETIRTYSKYHVIVTDRYHGTIFSLVAGTPVIVIKTTDHKVYTGAEWFTGVYDDYVFRAETLADVPSLVKHIIDNKHDHKMDPYFKAEYYDKLKTIIDCL